MNFLIVQIIKWISVVVARKRILFVVNVDSFFLSHRLKLAEAMKMKGYEVYILTKNTGYKRNIESVGLKFVDIDFDRSGVNPIKDLKVIFRLITLFKKLAPEIIHNVTIKPAIYSSIAFKFIKNKSNVKLINAISGLGYNFIGDRKSPIQLVVKGLMRFAFSNNSINFIFQNPDDLNLYREMKLVDNNFVIIKGAGVDKNEFNYSEPIKKDYLSVVLVARMLIDKGIWEYIEAAKLLFKEFHGKVRFFLVGDIDLGNRASLSETEINNCIIPEYLEWKGFQEDVKSILVSSDIVCLPSYREGLPKSLIEAMAIGRPIVTTDAPGCRECVVENLNGFLVKTKDSSILADKLRVLLKDGDLRIDMGHQSRKLFVKEMSLDIVIAQTLQYYFNLK